MEKMNLDQLQIEAQRLVALLQDRQPGLMTWRDSLHRRIMAILDETGYASLTDANQRMFDLVRFMRGELFEAGLITHDEYALLAQEHSAVKRLEDYDAAIAAIRNATNSANP